jgi:hypothetical protein
MANFNENDFKKGQKEAGESKKDGKHKKEHEEKFGHKKGQFEYKKSAEEAEEEGEY